MNKEEQKQHIIDLMNMGDYKQKTALQQLVTNLEKRLQDKDSNYEANLWVKKGILIAIREADKLLATERQQIESAWFAGNSAPLSSSIPSDFNTAEQYYSETFKPE